MNKNLYLVYGDEDFLIDNKILAIKEAFLGKNFTKTHVEILDGENETLDEIIAKLTAVSMFVTKRVVLVKNLVSRGRRRRKKDKFSNLTVLQNALDLIPAETCVIFVWPSSKIERGSVYDLLSEKAQTFEFKAFTDWQKDQVVYHVLQIAAEVGCQLDAATADYLVAVVGNGLRALHSEIIKLSNYVGENRRIKKGDIDALVSPGRIGVFQLVNYLKQKNLKMALTSFLKLTKLGEDPFSVLAVIASSFRTMLQVKLALFQSSDPFAVARRLGTSPYYVKQVIKDVKAFSPAQLKQRLLAIQEADLKFKTGFNKMVALEVLITEICSKETVVKA